jgi:hypothetical protein
MEKGKVTNCAACKACGGTSAKAKTSITIMAHGSIGPIRAYHRTRARLAALANEAYAMIAPRNVCVVP